MSKKKFPIQSVLFTAWLLATLTFSIYPWIQVDYSDNKAWWTIWPIVGVVSPVLFFGSIYWAVKSNKKFK